MSIKILEKIKKAEKKRQDLILRLLEEEKMVRGSFCQIYVKCGAKSCWCATGKGHPHKRMSWHEKGVSFSRAVPKDEYEWIEKMTNNFREYRKTRKKIAKIETEIKKLIDHHEEWILKKARKGKPYLEVWEIDDFGNKTPKSSRKIEMTKL